MPRRLTILFFGDSFLAGVGDPTALGWTGRVLASTARPGLDLTVYPLGVRRDTSVDVLERWEAEATVRAPGVGVTAVVFALGVNDATDGADGEPRVRADVTVANLRAIVARATELGLPVLLVGPPPIADARINDRILALDEQLMGAVPGVPAVSVARALLADDDWVREVRDGDGAHPGAAGYAALAALVRPVWEAWVEALRRAPEPEIASLRSGVDAARRDPDGDRD